MIAALLAQLALWFGFVSLSDRFQYGHFREERPLLEFICWWLLATVVLAFCASTAVRRRWSTGWILAGALVFRLVILPTNPVQEDDFYRYLWDGAVQKQGVNPYLFAPREVAAFEAVSNRAAAVSKLRLEEELGMLPFNRSADDLVDDLNRLTPLVHDLRLDELRYDDRWNPRGDLDRERIPVVRRINHDVLPTVYPPLAQAAFRLAAWIEEGSLRALRAVFIAVDMGTCLLLVGILAALGLPRQQVAWYAWNPLVIKEFVNSPHLDVLMVFCAAGAIWFWVRGRVTGAALMAGLGATAKLLTGLWLPLILLWKPRAWKAVLAGGLVVVGAFAWHQEAGDRRWQSMQVMGHVFNKNSVWPGMLETAFRRVTAADLDETLMAFESWHLYPVAEHRQGTMQKRGVRWTRHVLGAAILVWLATCFWRSRQERDRARQVGWLGLVIAGPLLLSPVQNPWYFGILMLWLAIRPRLSLVVLTGMLGLYYAFFWFRYHPGAATDAFNFRTIVNLEWAAVLVALVVERWGLRRSAAD